LTQFPILEAFAWRQREPRWLAPSCKASFVLASDASACTEEEVIHVTSGNDSRPPGRDPEKLGFASPQRVVILTLSAAKGKDLRLLLGFESIKRSTVIGRLNLVPVAAEINPGRIH